MKPTIKQIKEAIRKVDHDGAVKAIESNPRFLSVKESRLLMESLTMCDEVHDELGKMFAEFAEFQIKLTRAEKSLWRKVANEIVLEMLLQVTNRELETPVFCIGPHGHAEDGEVGMSFVFRWANCGTTHFLVDEQLNCEIFATPKAPEIWTDKHYKLKAQKSPRS